MMPDYRNKGTDYCTCSAVPPRSAASSFYQPWLAPDQCLGLSSEPGQCPRRPSDLPRGVEGRVTTASDSELSGGGGGGTSEWPWAGPASVEAGYAEASLAGRRYMETLVRLGRPPSLQAAMLCSETSLLERPDMPSPLLGTLAAAVDARPLVIDPCWLTPLWGQS